MLKRINDLLAGLPMTMVGGICLIFSFFLPRLGIELPIDPAWVSVFICGIPLLYLAIWRVIYNPGISKISSALLIDMAMLAAIAIGDLFAAGEVAFIMSLGAILEDMTTNRAKKGLHALIGLAPAQARRLTADGEELIAAERIERGDLLRILPGETIPADGVIVSGETSIDQSVMTGESLPVDRGTGDAVFCGTVNCFGSIDIRADKVGADSSLQKLIRLVEEAENKKAPMARIADKAASWLVPLALMIAVIAGLVTQDIVRAVTILVVFCPCALVLATPTAVMAAIGQATRHGVIIKSGEALEVMGKADTIAFDKTGTLTSGHLAVCDVIPCADVTEAELLSIAATAERKSEHPLGKAIVAEAAARGLSVGNPTAFSMHGGRGVRAECGGCALICGNEKFVRENGVPIPDSASTELETLRAQGKASILAVRDGVCIGVLALSDTLRETAETTVRRLSEAGARAVLLTGDNQKTANYFAARAGIDTVHAGLLPEEKSGQIVRLQEAGQIVCMVGDGVNDAPALKTANVGVAMGSMGSDLAVEAADIALMSDDISRLPYLKRLSVATIHTIKLSITLSMCINLIAVTCSVLGILNPTTGALVHNAGSCFVVLIAALLYDRKFE